MVCSFAQKEASVEQHNVHGDLGRGELGLFLLLVFKSWVWPPFNKLLMWPRALPSNWNEEGKTNKLWHLNIISASVSAPLNLLCSCFYLWAAFRAGIVCTVFCKYFTYFIPKGCIFKTFSVQCCSHLEGYKSSTVFLIKFAEKRK